MERGSLCPYDPKSLIAIPFNSKANLDSISTELNSQFQRRFAGLERLYGVRGAKAIANAHVVVVGIGGVGSWTAESFARCGVGAITLIDLDHISESNVNRQIHALTNTLGMSKVLAMRDRVLQINPECRVNCIDDFVTAENWDQIIQQISDTPISAVVDACDQVRAKVAIAAWAINSGYGDLKPLFITVGAAGGKRWAHKVDIQDLAKVSHDPLLAQLRMRLRKEHNAAREGKAMGIQCVFSTESVKEADPSCEVSTDGTLNCHGYGSTVSVTSTFGQCAAGWVCDQLTLGKD